VVKIEDGLVKPFPQHSRRVVAQHRDWPRSRGKLLGFRYASTLLSSKTWEMARKAMPRWYTNHQLVIERAFLVRTGQVGTNTVSSLPVNFFPIAPGDNKHNLP
jgi:hypothetical protein